jgi:hypothetical protein
MYTDVKWSKVLLLFGYVEFRIANLVVRKYS